MRGAFIFALATFVAPTLTAAVPVIGTSSLHVETSIKKDTEVLHADQLKPRNIPERPIVPGTLLGRTVLAEPIEALSKRDRGVGRPGREIQNSNKAAEDPVERRGLVRWNQRNAESTEDLDKRTRRVNWPREGAQPTEDLEKRGRRVNWPREDIKATEDLEKRTRRVNWPREGAQPTEDLEKRGRRVNWPREDTEVPKAGLVDAIV